jgi:Flp pilus assembly protein TadG
MKKHSARSERGAALVEMAMVLPLLIVLLFGIMETGWLFSQHVELRHSSREAARIAAVSSPDGNNGGFDATDIRDRICDTTGLSGDTLTEIALTSTGADIGDNATVEITADYQSLTGLLDPIFGSITIDNSVDFRLEQPRLWVDTTFNSAPVCP